MTTDPCSLEALANDPLLSMVTQKKPNNGTFHAVRGDEDDSEAAAQSISSSHDQESSEQEHKTSFWQTYVHLLKGYIGCGVLSLPWAVSQLGLPLGCVSIFIMSLWSSYNCWTVVKLKRFIEKTNNTPAAADTTTASAVSSPHSSRFDMSETRSEGAASSVTYPDVGHWAYGSSFHTYITACIIIQQLAICTVFLSFIGENVHAVLDFCGITILSRLQVLSLALPPVLLLCFLPTLRHLAPVMVAATMLILFGFICLASVGYIEWDDRPLHTPSLQWTKAPLALCAILYSFEGICLVLPVESAMKEPRDFQKAFVWSMASVACILAVVAGLSVVAFGYVSNGSITAFLLQEYGDDKSHTFYLMLVNTAVSVSILLTYPLQLFPAVELMAPIMAKYVHGVDDDDELDLVSFDPLPPIDEHDVMSVGSLPSHHDYNNNGTDGVENDESVNVSFQVRDRWSVLRRLMPQMILPGDSLLLRALLVLSTYAVASLVPNVENLISLAGALAGSSTALLIPPILELAWIKQLQKGDAGPSPVLVDANDSASWILASGRDDKFLFEKIKSWILLILGAIFACIGTYASISDIVRLYRH
jgi:amino acid permease